MTGSKNFSVYYKATKWTPGLPLSVSKLQIKIPAFARAQWDFWTHPPTRWTQQMRGQCSRFPVSSRRDQMTKQKHQEVKDHECGAVSTGYYTIIHPWVKTYEKLSSLNRGVFLFVCLFFPVLIVRVWAQVRWVFYSDSHRLQLRVCVIWSALSSGGLAEAACASKPIQEVGRIHCLAVEWLRLMASYWLLTGGHPQVLGAVLISLPYRPFHKQFPVLICFLRPPE